MGACQQRRIGHLPRRAGDRQAQAILTNSQKVKNTVLAEMGMGYVLALSRSIDVTLQNHRAR